MLAGLRAIEDPEEKAKAITEALRRMPSANQELKQMRLEVVTYLREVRGKSHAEIAVLLDSSRSRAQQIAEGRRSGKRSDGPDPDDEV